jgi:hypothetical protein
MASFIDSRLNTFFQNPYTTIAALIGAPASVGILYATASLCFDLAIDPFHALAFGSTIFIIGCIVKPIFESLFGSKDDLSYVYCYLVSWVVATSVTPFLLSLCGITITALTALELTISSVALPLIAIGIVLS